MLSSLFVVALGLGAQANWKPLFTGDSLAGFTQKGGKAVFRIENGELVGESRPNTPNSFLCTDKEYGDFELEFQVKCNPQLNSGVQIRSNSILAYKNGVVHGYQVEIDPSPRAYTGGIYDESRRGVYLQDPGLFPKGRRAFLEGQWNTIRVKAIGNRIETWVNGVQTADLRDDVSRSGFIGFQVHNVGSLTDKLEVRWRNVRIRDLGIQDLTPPKNGEWLLRTKDDLKKWVHEGSKEPVKWEWDGEGLTVNGTGNIITKRPMGDSRVHLEFMTDENGKEGQANGNSGVYMQQRYEVQILNSAPREPKIDECGAIYSVKAPDFPMAKKAGEWQRYDIYYWQPKWVDGKKVSNARMTVYHNGTRVHDYVEVPRATTAGAEESPLPMGLRLQDHGNRVRFRNIWIAPL
jgi:hypothetical protein